MAANNGVNLFQMDFWDGMEPVFMMPTITPAERKAVWDAVADSVQQQLSLHKGIRIPTLGSFDVVHAETLVGNKTVTLQRPVFHLARNLGGVHSLENKDNLAGSKQLEPLKYARVAVEASVSRRKAECCVLGTTSLLYHCLEKGVSVAFVLRDVGVLFIEGSRVQMRFYLDFLEKVTGERIQDGDTLKALQQLDMVTSQAVSTASLSSTGRVITFPNFEQTFPATSLPRDHLKDFGFVPGEDKKNKTDLSPLRQGMEGRFSGLPVPAQKDSSAKAAAQPSLREEEAMEIGPSSRVRAKRRSGATKRQQQLRGAEKEEEKEEIPSEKREKRKFSLEKKEKEGILLEEKEKEKEQILLEIKQREETKKKEKEGILLEIKQREETKKKEKEGILLEEKEREEKKKEKEGNLSVEKEKEEILSEEEKRKLDEEKKKKQKMLLEVKEKRKFVPKEEKMKFLPEGKEKKKFLPEEEKRKPLSEEKKRKFI
ncbi:hypothetical protein DUI87_32604 [Hirundo rustica rustica]|uniref:CCDC81 HU domain-containing protein n=1 Tax=Hirundo rustica rustica TaxID=333673 RepID=A0A3M0J8S4_HIRRU|nr:hypothetical protein DUI87_32604 [Hirundo rustica rustica]